MIAAAHGMACLGRSSHPNVKRLHTSAGRGKANGVAIGRKRKAAPKYSVSLQSLLLPVWVGCDQAHIPGSKSAAQ